jgi:hypothetical protein
MSEEGRFTIRDGIPMKVEVVDQQGRLLHSAS